MVNGSSQLGGGGGRGGGGGWSLEVPIYGPASVIRAQLDYARSKFEAIEGCTFTETQMIMTQRPGEDAPPGVRLVNFGVPNLSTFSLLGRSQFQPNPAGGHIGFSPILPRRGEELLRFRDFFRSNSAEISGGENLGIQGPVFMTNWERSLVGLIMFPVSKNVDENRKIRAAFEKWVDLAAAEGWTEYRAPTVYQDLVAGTYSSNDTALRRMREKLKDAVDPNGIISAGRYGVWPKHLRDV
jgi:4-cresol dehydrogenase (hydroxylating)